MALDILFFQPSLITESKISFSAISNGLIALSLYLRKKGFTTKICHFNGWTGNLANFVQEKIGQYNPRFIGINLTWHVHIYTTIEIIKVVKKIDKSCPIVIGGFTASYFSKEIFKHLVNSDIDPKNIIVIRGDAEKPLYDFIAIDRIPDNNTHFNGKKIIQKPLEYIQQELPFVRLNWPLAELVDNWMSYINRCGIRTSIPGLEDQIGHNTAPGEFHLYIGKGCQNNCCYCGGGRDIQQRLFGRKKPLFRSVEDVIYDLNQLEKDGIRTVYIDFDPDPSREYYQNLFQNLRPLNLNLIFSAWCGPVGSELLDSFQQKFESVEIVISPETGSEQLRKKLLQKGYGKPPFYSNKKLVEFFRQLQRRKFKSMCYFIAGLPGETEEDETKTKKLMGILREDFADLFIKSYDLTIQRNLCCPPLYPEPGSSLSLSFEDYLNNSKHPQEYPIYTRKE